MSVFKQWAIVFVAHSSSSMTISLVLAICYSIVSIKIICEVTVYTVSMQNNMFKKYPRGRRDLLTLVMRW